MNNNSGFPALNRPRPLGRLLAGCFFLSPWLASADITAPTIQLFPTAVLEEVKHTGGGSEGANNPPTAKAAPSPITASETPYPFAGQPTKQPASAALRTHLLWSPFRTRSAATGFARRLSQVSGVAVRVAESEPGHYRVGFDYPDELQKNWLLGQIQARTGLDLDVLDTTENAMDDNAGNPDSAVSAAGLPNG